MNPSELTMTLLAYSSVFPRSHHTTSSPNKSFTTPADEADHTTSVPNKSFTTPADEAAINKMIDAAIHNVNLPDYTPANRASLAYSLAARNHPPTEAGYEVLRGVAEGMALVNLTKVPNMKDLSMVLWSLGTLSEGDRRLGEFAAKAVETVGYLVRRGRIEVGGMSNEDLMMVVAGMSYSRVEDMALLSRLFEEGGRREWKCWERVNLCWAVAHLYLKGAERGEGEFEGFVKDSVKVVKKDLEELHKDQQASANLVWALTVLEMDDEESMEVVKSVFGDMERRWKRGEEMDKEHLHQLYQAWFLSEELEGTVGREFGELLRATWEREKAREKASSRSHLQLSKVLSLMGIKHANEHDEDIDVAIVLDTESGWSRIDSSRGGGENRTYVAVEYDGPDHFTYKGKKSLGHTNLKYRVLKKKGWAVVRVPYFVWDRIPFWASMERQRYLQRLLKTDKAIRFSEGDVSEYKEPAKSVWLNRVSRFD